jgi:hypothetical protein
MRGRIRVALDGTADPEKNAKNSVANRGQSGIYYACQDAKTLILASTLSPVRRLEWLVSPQPFLSSS